MPDLLQLTLFARGGTVTLAVALGMRGQGTLGEAMADQEGIVTYRGAVSASHCDHIGHMVEGARLASRRLFA